MKPETVLIDFKDLGVPASINKSDFNPKVHKIWYADKQRAFDAPLASIPEEPTSKAGRPAKIKNAGK